MPVFPSSDWMAAYCAALAAHPEAAELARGLDGVYRFVIEPGGPLAEPHDYAVEIRPGAGQAPPTITPRQDVPAAEAELSISAAYPQWRQLVAGKLDLAMALMLRRVKVGGNLQRLTGRLSSAQPLLEALRSVETIWLEDA